VPTPAQARTRAGIAWLRDAESELELPHKQNPEREQDNADSAGDDGDQQAQGHEVSISRSEVRHTYGMDSGQAQVSLLRWLRRQLRQREGIRERIEAAVANDDPGELRRLVESFSFSDAQRRHVLGLVEHWEQARAREHG
jgi:hypothetical protein